MKPNTSGTYLVDRLHGSIDLSLLERGAVIPGLNCYDWNYELGDLTVNGVCYFQSGGNTWEIAGVIPFLGFPAVTCILWQRRSDQAWFIGISQNHLGELERLSQRALKELPVRSFAEFSAYLRARREAGLPLIGP